MNFTAAKFSDLIHGKLSFFTCSSTYGKSKQCFISVQTGIDISEYKDEKGRDLTDLMLAVKDADTRIRLGSIEVSLITEAFLAALKQVRHFAPQFHLSLQSGSNKVLKSMNRHYTREEYLEKCKMIYEAFPMAAITTDIIVGFPGETEEDFLQTLEFCKKARFLKIHIFPYSKRAGTPAATMKGQISTEKKSRRLHELEKICQENTAKLLSREVAERDEREVLFETFKDGYAYGHTDDFLEICAPSERDMRGEIAKVKLISSDGKQILAALEK